MSKANKKLVIFDFDGTLVDTIIDAGRCFNKALECFGFRTYPVEQYGQIVGGNLDVIFSKLLDKQHQTEENLSKLKAKYREIYASDEKPNTKPFNGILSVLERLTQAGVSIAINTNKAQVLVDDLCAKVFPTVKFIAVCGYSDGVPSKPDPYAVNEIMKACNVNKGETVYVGDGLTDVKTAQNAGVDCILVTWGQGDVEEILNENPALFVANEPSEILKFL